MSQSFIFWKGCWIYLSKKQSEAMREIIQILKKKKSATTGVITSLATKGNRTTIRSLLYYLLVARVVRVEQHKDAHVYFLLADYEQKLLKALTPYRREEEQDETYNNQTVEHEA